MRPFASTIGLAFWGMSLACSLSLAGCGDPLKPGQRIDGPRILGARLSTADDESTLEPGQPAQAELLVAGADGPLAARLAYSVCEAADSVRGVPYCADAPFAEGVVDVGSAPFAFDVPPALSAGARLALLGAVCVAGEPMLASEPADWTCSDGKSALKLSFDAWTRDADLANENPDLTALGVSLDGSPIALDTPASPPNCDPTTPSASPGVTHTLDIDVGAAARESGEALQASHFSTRGLFDRQYTFVAPDQPLRVSIDWDAPAAMGPVKQYLVLRDGRGGTSWASWTLCVR